MEKWKIVESKVLAQNTMCTLKSEKCITDEGVEIENYFNYELPTIAIVVAGTKENKFLIIEQYRHSIGEVIHEFPAGRAIIGEDFLETAKRELREETGYITDEIYLEKEFYPLPALINCKVEVYFARNVKSIGNQELDNTENINIKLVDLDELQNMIESGEFKNSNMVAAALLAVQKKDWFINR